MIRYSTCMLVWALGLFCTLDRMMWFGWYLWKQIDVARVYNYRFNGEFVTWYRTPGVPLASCRYNRLAFSKETSTMNFVTFLQAQLWSG